MNDNSNYKTAFSMLLTSGLILLSMLLSNDAYSAEPIDAHGFVVVHIDNQASLSRDEIRKIFLGKQKSFDNGLNAKPFLLDGNEEVIRHFNQGVILKSNRQMKAYWAKRVFTGKGVSPDTVSTDQLIQKLNEIPGAIGYLGADVQLNDSLRIVDSF